jgi:hypothetical protein
MSYIIVDNISTFYTTYYMIALALMVILIWAFSRNAVYEGMNNPSSVNIPLGPDADFVGLPKLYNQQTFMEPDQSQMDSLLTRNVPTNLELGDYNGMIEVGLYGSVPVYMMTPYDSKNGHRFGATNSGLYLINNKTIWQDQERPRESEYWDAIKMLREGKLHEVPLSMRDFSPDGRYSKSLYTPEKWAK